MSQLAIDPIGYSEALQKAGMPKEQADLIAKTQEAKIDAIVSIKDLATKKDLHEMEARMTKAMYNAFFGFAGVIIAIVAVAILK